MKNRLLLSIAVLSAIFTASCNKAPTGYIESHAEEIPGSVNWFSSGAYCNAVHLNRRYIARSGNLVFMAVLNNSTSAVVNDIYVKDGDAAWVKHPVSAAITYAANVYILGGVLHIVGNQSDYSYAFTSAADFLANTPSILTTTNTGSQFPDTTAVHINYGSVYRYSAWGPVDVSDGTTWSYSGSITSTHNATDRAIICGSNTLHMALLAQGFDAGVNYFNLYFYDGVTAWNTAVQEPIAQSTFGTCSGLYYDTDKNQYHMLINCSDMSTSWDKSFHGVYDVSTASFSGFQPVTIPGINNETSSMVMIKAGGKLFIAIGLAGNVYLQSLSSGKSYLIGDFCDMPSVFTADPSTGTSETESYVDLLILSNSGGSFPNVKNYYVRLDRAQLAALD